AHVIRTSHCDHLMRLQVEAVCTAGPRSSIENSQEVVVMNRTAKRIWVAAIAAVACATAAAAVQAADISGAGATFPYPIYSKWADAYKKQTGIGLNYQSIGSGAGIKQIK